jgi:N-acetylglucosaminyldiphosphoundecaprenol N-acetyl-beta-D-mannosaminyltransferase
MGVAASPPQTTICGVKFSCFDRERAARWLLEAAQNGRGGHVCVTGAHGIVTAHDDADFRNILNSAAMNTLDGQPVAWIARWRGFAAERVTGRELMWDVVAQDQAGQIRHVLFGATSAVTDRMIDRLRELNGKIRVEAFNPPFGILADEELDGICRRLESAEPTIIWVGLSTPKQEQLAVRLTKRLPAAPIVAIGAGFDFVAGLKPCAPAVVKLLCLEWLFRLLSDPRRLSKRYAQVVPRFLLLLGREITTGRDLGSSLRRPTGN